MAKKRFVIDVSAVVEVELDDSLVPDDEWRETFYAHINTLGDLAAHVAYNAAANGVRSISRLDGFADRDDSLCAVKVKDWEAELRKLK